MSAFCTKSSIKKIEWIFRKGFAFSCLLRRPYISHGLLVRWDLVRGGHQTYIEHTRFLGCNHDYRVILHDDGSTNSLKLPLVSYSTDEGVTCACWGVGAARGRGTEGCEEVGKGADSQRSQRGAFSLEGVELFRVYSTCVVLCCNALCACSIC